MIKRDLYCLKNDKLELSILDEGIEEIEEIMLDTTSDEEDAGGYEMNVPPIGESTLQVSEEVYNTLKIMGEFLTQTESTDITDLPKTSKAHTLSETMLVEDTQIISKMIAIRDYMNHPATLQQSSIDALLLTQLGEVKPKFQYADELRQKIEDQIKKIKDYR
ncbi:hypothetical protein [Cellulosilyticum sp. I15G10I2]|uniref:hypothetical protein n=1 Tax=Cellulosilyticum sp. I15G10I2 TaxID=1892843 RepID=UPI00085C6EE4|nr:hypothetical protein [Cellulosilyticum sp. I15G10I2]